MNHEGDRSVIPFPPELVEAIAQRAAAIVLAAQRERPEGRWLAGAQAAADYLGCSPQRVYKRLHVIPHHKDGARLMFSTAELDRWLDAHREPG